MGNMKRYEQVPHTADLAAKIYGKTLEKLFENAAFSMFDMMANLEGLAQEEERKIELKAPDKESLLILWLNELLFSSYEEKVLYSDFSIEELTETRIKARVKGAKIDPSSPRMQKEIKAATYHDLKIGKTGKGFEVTVVFDI